jgi:pilus assembly protein Flp/PilA
METLTRIYISLTNLAVRAKDEDGATAVEYGLLVALIAAVIIVTVALLGTQINNAFLKITGQTGLK